MLPEVITRAARVVLDADALNTIATEAALHGGAGGGDRTLVV